MPYSDSMNLHRFRTVVVAGALLLISMLSSATAVFAQVTDPDRQLTVGDVERIIAQAVQEAQERGASATIAVVDRVGNVLGVFRMNGAQTLVRVSSERGVTGGLEQIAVIPDTLAAIAKAITGAFLSSGGNAFTTRTANQIVQEHFNPGEIGQPGGPLFGVQISSLPCSDLNRRFDDGLPDAGPKRSPLGLSADPGGLPLYKGATLVGAIGVISDGLYGLDLVVTDIDRDQDELIAVAGTFGYAAPADIRANRISVDGKLLRFAEVDFKNLASNPSEAPPFSAIDGVLGSRQAVRGYTDGELLDGTIFGEPESGIRPDALDFPGLDGFVLVDENNVERFRPKDGADLGGIELKEFEVRQILASALDVANRARAQIRRPLGSAARVSIFVVDTEGDILGMVRGRDAPAFGLDVSLQKARTAAFFSNFQAAQDLTNAPDALYISPDASQVQQVIRIGDYVTAVREFTGNPDALANGIAFSDRSGGNLSRPFYPDGIAFNDNGPFSKPFPNWSPFTTGLQLDLSINGILQHVLFALGIQLQQPDGTLVEVPDVGMNCSVVLSADLLAALRFPDGTPVVDQSVTPPFIDPERTPITRIPNGIQIFPGSVPIFRGDTLVGGIGVSGDGIDQDDMVSILGLHNAGLILGTGVGNAPRPIRSDTVSPNGLNLRYVQCPFAPFNNSNEQNVCEGL